MPKKRSWLANCLRKRRKLKRMAAEQTTAADVNSTFEGLQGRMPRANFENARKQAITGKAAHLKERAAIVKEVLNLKLPKKKK